MRVAGETDLFVTLCVVLPLATAVSAASVGTNVRLLYEQARFRQVQLGGRESVRSRRSAIELQWLAMRYVLHRDQEKHREKMAGNYIALRQFYLGMLLLFLEVRSISYPLCWLRNAVYRRRLPGSPIGFTNPHDPADFFNATNRRWTSNCQPFTFDQV